MLLWNVWDPLAFLLAGWIFVPKVGVVLVIDFVPSVLNLFCEFVFFSYYFSSATMLAAVALFAGLLGLFVWTWTTNCMVFSYGWVFVWYSSLTVCGMVWWLPGSCPICSKGILFLPSEAPNLWPTVVSVVIRIGLRMSVVKVYWNLNKTFSRWMDNSVTSRMRG